MATAYILQPLAKQVRPLLTTMRARRGAIAHPLLSAPRMQNLIARATAARR